MYRHWLTIALLIALFTGGILLLESPPEVFQPNTVTLPSEEDVHLTGYLTGVTTTQYNQTGTVEYHFTANQMSHFQPDPNTVSTNDYTTINAPFFTFFQEDSSPWYVRAQQGRSTQNGELMILQNDVRVWQENEGTEPTVITTSELHIRPQKQVAETDQFVIITRPQIITQGVGMRANLEQETFAILSEGNTIYEPNP
jgi:lipopolysaccharide export system protein LptC